MMRTSNVETRNPNAESAEFARTPVRRSTFRFRRSAFVFLLTTSFAADDPLASARTALAEHLPQIALQKLATLDSPEAALLRAEAHIAAGTPDTALAALAPLAKTDPRAALLQAHAFASAGRWTEARTAYTRIASQPVAPLSAKLGVAESCQALGDTAAAIATLEPLSRTGSAPVAVRLRLAGLYVEASQGSRARKLLNSTNPESAGDRLWARYIEGRLLLLENQPAAARAIFAGLLATQQQMTENLFVAATLGAIEARIAQQGSEAADNELETFIWRNPDSAWLELMFRRLDQIYAAERNAQEGELQKWAVKPQQRRAALARFYVGKLQVRERKWEKALASLDMFLRSFPSHPFAPFAELLRADVFIERGELDSAVRALESAARIAGQDSALRAEVELRTGLVQMRQREFVLAATSLEHAAERPGPAKSAALYDAALAWLNQTNYERFLDAYRRLGERAASGELRGNLILEEGLVRARLRDPGARGALRRFIEQFPSHPRVAEARLADAEISFDAAQFKESAALVRVANEKPHPAEMDDHASYLAIFLSDAKEQRDDAEVIRLAKEFIRARPKSALMPEVRMKLGEVFFRQTDYPNSETQFATLAREAPQSAFAETALFLAGQSAMRTINTGSTERALGYFDEVVKRAGALRLHAREQQAIIQGRLGKDAEAIALYDLILEAKPAADADLRAAALIGKGDILSRKDSPQIEAAIGVFDQLATDDSATLPWRFQALYKKGRALDQLGRKPEAIAVFNDVLDRNAAATGREFFWFYKAGFEAARRYEQQSAWPAAIAIYEKIARIEGPRAAEAKARAKQLRVEHFVWD